MVRFIMIVRAQICGLIVFVRGLKANKEKKKLRLLTAMMIHSIQIKILRN
jgi:hypothetical protein